MKHTVMNKRPLSLAVKTNRLYDLIDDEGKKQYELFKYKVTGGSKYISIYPKGKKPSISGSGYYDTLVFGEELVVRCANIWGEGDRNEDPKAKYPKKIGSNRDMLVVYEGNTDSEILEFFEGRYDYDEYLKISLDNLEILTKDLQDLMSEGEDATIRELAIENSKLSEEEFDQSDVKAREAYLNSAKNTLFGFSVIKTPNKEEKKKKKEPLTRTFSIVSYRYKNLNIKKENKRTVDQLVGYVQKAVLDGRISADDSRFYFLNNNKETPKIYNLVNVTYVDPKNTSSKKLYPVKVGGKEADYYDYFSEDNLINWFSSQNLSKNNTNIDVNNKHCRDPLDFPYYQKSPIIRNDIVYVKFKPWVSCKEGGKASFQFRLEGGIQLLARLKNNKAYSENTHVDSFSDKIKEKLKNCDYFGEDPGDEIQGEGEGEDGDFSNKRSREEEEEHEEYSQHSQESLEERERMKKRKFDEQNHPGDDN